MIELRDVSIRFRYQSVLRNINLAIQPGQTVCIIGESGCGKTVMLKLIIGLLRPTSGTVFSTAWMSRVWTASSSSRCGCGLGSSSRWPRSSTA